MEQPPWIWITNKSGNPSILPPTGERAGAREKLLDLIFARFLVVVDTITANAIGAAGPSNWSSPVSMFAD